MARPLRLFTKKRGHRRSGSKTLASAGEILFFGFVFVVGAVFLILLLAKIVLPEWRANHEFVETTARVLDKRIDEQIGRGRTATFRPQVEIQYRVGEKEYRIWTYDITGAYSRGRDDKRALLDPLEIGGQYKCWFDPLDPDRAVLVRGYSWWFWLLVLAPAGFMLIGGGRLIYALWQWGKSPEHRAVQGRPGRLELLNELDIRSKLLPSVPRDDNITNSPGTHLKYRLPIEGSHGWRLFAATMTSLLWNGIVSLFIVIAIRNHLRGTPDWWLDLFIVPFFATGGFLTYFFVRELLIATGVGPTQIELSDHPLVPARDYEVYISQAGHLTMNRFELSLECEESATYRLGTDARTERRRVFHRAIFEQRNFEVRPGTPYEAHCRFDAPSGAMHSFKSDHNEVQWKLVVRGDAAGWPDFERSFPVVVLPPAEMRLVVGDPAQAVLARHQS
ncbi:MAG: DUF3592 domain-containing protein [Pirellulales bacterium]|nr:DUF3592 domain-containing protein [Pirellulales bacterium]